MRLSASQYAPYHNPPASLLLPRYSCQYALRQNMKNERHARSGDTDRFPALLTCEADKTQSAASELISDDGYNRFVPFNTKP